MCNVKDVALCDKLFDNYQPTLLFPSASLLLTGFSVFQLIVLVLPKQWFYSMVLLYVY